MDKVGDDRRLGSLGLHLWRQCRGCVGNKGYRKPSEGHHKILIQAKLSRNQSSLSSTAPDSWAPMTGISGNTEYVAWRSNPGSSTSQEYVSVSLNAGSTWSAPTAIGIAGHDNSWPVTVPAYGSTAFIAWYVRTGTSSSTPWEAVVVETTNSGSSWSSPVILGGSLAESDIATAAISANAGTVFAVWTDTTSSGNTQVYFTTGS